MITFKQFLHERDDLDDMLDATEREYDLKSLLSAVSIELRHWADFSPPRDSKEVSPFSNLRTPSPNRPRDPHIPKDHPNAKGAFLKYTLKNGLGLRKLDVYENYTKNGIELYMTISKQGSGGTWFVVERGGHTRLGKDLLADGLEEKIINFIKENNTED